MADVSKAMKLAVNNWNEAHPNAHIGCDDEGFFVKSNGGAYNVYPVTMKKMDGNVIEFSRATSGRVEEDLVITITNDERIGDDRDLAVIMGRLLDYAAVAYSPMRA